MTATVASPMKIADKKKNSGESKTEEMKGKHSEAKETLKEKFKDCKEKASDLLLKEDRRQNKEENSKKIPQRFVRLALALVPSPQHCCILFAATSTSHRSQRLQSDQCTLG